MGVAIRRVGCLCLLALGVVGLSPAAAGAVRLGSSQMDPTLTDFGGACIGDPCLFVQKRLPGLPTRAPFSGVIHKWHVVSTGVHDFQLIVMHKKPNGKYKNVGQSSIESVPGYGAYEFSASMPIHKGEFVGLSGEAVAGIDNNTATTLHFEPTVPFGDARKPSFSGADEYQYNAIVRHH